VIHQENPILYGIRLIRLQEVGLAQAQGGG